MLPRFLKGRRVACAAADPKVTGGMWAEYVVTSAQFCIPLRKHVDLEQGAALLINPRTAWGLMHKARRGRHRAVVQTAAASALGRMIVRLGKRFSIPVINVVRQDEQVELLRRLGAEYVLNSSESEFDKRLRVYAINLGQASDLMLWPARCPLSCCEPRHVEATCWCTEPCRCSRATPIRHP